MNLLPLYKINLCDRVKSAWRHVRGVWLVDFTHIRTYSLWWIAELTALATRLRSALLQWIRTLRYTAPLLQGLGWTVSLWAVFELHFAFENTSHKITWSWSILIARMIDLKWTIENFSLLCIVFRLAVCFLWLVYSMTSFIGCLLEIKDLVFVHFVRWSFLVLQLHYKGPEDGIILQDTF